MDDIEKKLAKRWFFKYTLFKEQIEATGKYPIFQTKLGVWVNNQRIAYKKSLLCPEQVRLLDKINFVYSLDDKWYIKYNKVKNFIQENKRFPISKDGNIGHWVNHQKQRRKKGTMKDHQISELDKLNISWAKR